MRPEEARLRRLNQRNTFMSFPERPNAQSILLVFKDYTYKNRDENYGALTRTLGNTRATADPLGQIGSAIKGFSGIELPFPQQLQDNTSVRLNGFDRSLISERIAGALTNQMGAKGSLADIGTAAKDITGAMADILQGVGGGFVQQEGGPTLSEKITSALEKIAIKDAASGAAYLLRNFLPGDIARSVGVYAGNTVNPKETLAFEGVNLKSHTFNWQLFPYSKKDSEIIKQMTYFIKGKMLPQAVDIGEGAFNIKKAFLNYPSVVEIHLLGVDPSHFPSYKPCMISGFTSDYSPAGQVALMQGGKPSAVNFSLELQELEIHTSNDYISQATGTTESEPAQQ